MLTIREEQMEVFRQAARPRFVERMMEHLRVTYTEQTAQVSDPALQADVENGIECASGYGIETKYEIQQFLECRIELGPDFDTAPETAWAGEILHDGQMSAEEKMDAITDRMAFNAIDD